MKKINQEPEGHSKVEEGYTDPLLKIDVDSNGIPIKLGKHNLTAKYLPNEYYGGSNVRSVLYYGSKVWVHCPPIYIYQGESLLHLTANIFSKNQRVHEGEVKFLLNSKSVSEQLRVTDGFVTTLINQKQEQDKTYECIYDGYIPETLPDEEWENHILSESNGKGNIHVIELKGTPLCVEVSTIIVCTNEVSCLIARVYHKNYGTVINSADVPMGGTITFNVEGIGTIGNINITSSGYAIIPFTAPSKIGVYDIVATYTPSDELEYKYSSMSGGGTLYVTDDNKIKPNITLLSGNCGTKNKTSTLFCSSSKKMDGYVQVYIDSQLVPLKNTNMPDYKFPINTKGVFDISFDVPSGWTTQKLWVSAGSHNLVLKYTSKENMEYYYYLPNFYIQITTGVEIEVMDYDTSMGRLVIQNQNVIEQVPQKYIVIGDKIHFNITDKENTENIIKDGILEVTIKSTEVKL